jgi:hypothetical protein
MLLFRLCVGVVVFWVDVLFVVVVVLFVLFVFVVVGGCSSVGEFWFR